jgi:hypothetical protein
MSISAVGSAGATAFVQQYSVGIAKKSLDAQKQTGEQALQLIASAQPPLKPGQTINVMA